MKYKIGDVVRIKTWEKLAEEYRTRPWGWLDDKESSIKMNHLVTWTESNEEEFVKKNPDRIVTIIRENDTEILDYIVEELLVFEPIENRWEILDL